MFSVFKSVFFRENDIKLLTYVSSCLKISTPPFFYLIITYSDFCPAPCQAQVTSTSPVCARGDDTPRYQRIIVLR